MIIAARIALLGSLLWGTPIPAAAGDPAGLPHALATLRQVGPLGQGHPEAVTAWRTVSQASAAQLTQILAGMDDANPLANNWIRAAVDTIAQRTSAPAIHCPWTHCRPICPTRRIRHGVDGWPSSGSREHPSGGTAAAGRHRTAARFQPGAAT